ncbi:OLC1v1003517C1 [Oldenlandia corymbosa var. corymbosa]|uniref:OLC1v1003517C1 n=1 Tax=Oldenlandia corymbosa var. corymbosa TaxID=529605 RepID=A0AAV1DAD1_OLDCO|nr:OLC1v1003517C1 [Oldenlandia corymbosa var. corymbosa]
MGSLQYSTNATRITPPFCGLSKQGQRLLTSIATSTAAKDHHHRLLRKFVKSSSKHVALNTLSHLLSPPTTASAAVAGGPHLSSLVLPLYLMITEEASWFSWNAKLVADVIAAMYKQHKFSDAERLMDEAIAKIGSQNTRDLCTFYCYLIDSTAKHQLKQEVLSCITLLRELIIASSSSIHVQKRAYDSMVAGLCEIGMPREAEDLMRGMMIDTGLKKLKPSSFMYRSLVYAYGRLGLFEDVKRNVDEMGGELDTVCSNMVLSALGAYNDLPEMVSRLKRMKVSKVPFSVRTYNSVLNSCPTIMSMLEVPERIPLSIGELMEKLGSDEANVVKELIDPSSSLTMMDGVIEWKGNEMKLDLHGLHLSSSFVIFLQWIEELRQRWVRGREMGEPEVVVPVEITVVCGLGKNSVIRGVSPVKGLLKEMIIRMKCPLKIDRKNIGCFVTKGKVFRDWLFATH